MCAFSQISSTNTKAKEGGNKFRPPGKKQHLMSTKNISEDYEISLANDQGTDGRPRFKEEIKLPPQYESIDLNDPNDEVLF